MLEIPPPLPAIGDVLAGKYRVTRILGRGGMGAVFAAHHELLHQEVAIKLMLRDPSHDADAVRRFLNEARAAASIRGEHVVRVFDVGQLEDGRPFMSMELLEGEDLEHVLARTGPLPPALAVDYVLQAMEAVAQAHARGIVHRDLKPSNLFLTKHADGRPLVKVLDFGIAKALDPRAAAITSSLQTLGSPLYMSPEQVRNAKSADAQSDLWSLGAILYELLAGTAPFGGQSLGELFLAIVETTPAPVHTKRPEVPQGLSDVVAHCLTRERAARVKTIEELAAALMPYASSAGAPSAGRIAVTMARTERASDPTAAAIGIATTIPSTPELPSSQTADSWTKGRESSTRHPRTRAVALAASGIVVVASALSYALLRSSDRAPAPVAHDEPIASGASEVPIAPTAPTPAPSATASAIVDATAPAVASTPARTPPPPPPAPRRPRSTAPSASASPPPPKGLSTAVPF